MLRRIVAVISLCLFLVWLMQPVPTAGVGTSTHYPMYVYVPIAQKNIEPTATQAPTAQPEPTATSQPSDGWVTVLQDGFEGDFPGPWLVQDLSGPGSGEYWPWRKDCKRATGQGSVWLVAGGADGQRMPCGFNYPNNARAGMYYGPFSLRNTAAANASAKLFVQTYNSEDLVCLIAYDDRSTDTAVGGWCYWGYADSGLWVDAFIDLNDLSNIGSLIGHDEVIVGIVLLSDESGVSPNGGHVDDVVISKYATGLIGDPGDSIEPLLPDGIVRVPLPTELKLRP